MKDNNKIGNEVAEGISFNIAIETIMKCYKESLKRENDLLMEHSKLLNELLDTKEELLLTKKELNEVLKKEVSSRERA